MKADRVMNYTNIISGTPSKKQALKMKEVLNFGKIKCNVITTPSQQIANAKYYLIKLTDQKDYDKAKFSLMANSKEINWR